MAGHFLLCFLHGLSVGSHCRMFLLLCLATMLMCMKRMNISCWDYFLSNLWNSLHVQKTILFMAQVRTSSLFSNTHTWTPLLYLNSSLHLLRKYFHILFLFVWTTEKGFMAWAFVVFWVHIWWKISERKVVSCDSASVKSFATEEKHCLKTILAMYFGFKSDLSSSRILLFQNFSIFI